MKSINRHLARLAGRFPRVAYYYSSPQVWAWAGIWYAAALFRTLAEDRVIPHPLWLPATVLAVGAALVLAIEAWHAAICPCVTDSGWTEEPEETPGEVE